MLQRRPASIRYPAEGPQQDAVCRPAHLPASHGVPELVRQHYQKQRQILENVPDDRGVPPLPVLNLNDGDEKPGPMQE
jgi:hypothetical protein